MRVIKALIFDFDGMILDTELPILRAWQQVYHGYGYDLPFEKYALTVGTDDSAFNPLEYLGKLVGDGFSTSEATEKLSQYINNYIEAGDLMPGVRDYLVVAKTIGLRIAIASSSNLEWVEAHLNRLNCETYFDAVVAAGSSYPPKPDPTVYRVAAEKLGISSVEGIAFEDSVNGVRAARAAGIFCVAVPNSVTVNMDFHEADLQIPSLLTINLKELIKIVESK